MLLVPRARAEDGARAPSEADMHPTNATDTMRQPLSSRGRTVTEEVAIQRKLDELTRMLAARDARGLAALFVPGARTFDVDPPLATSPSTSERVRAYETWFASWESPIIVEPTQTKIDVRADLAVVQTLVHMTGTKRGGPQTDTWFRSTIVMQKIGGEWMITHEHTSVPFDAETHVALLDLKP